MAYKAVEVKGREIISRTRGTGGLSRVTADLEKELGERALKQSGTEEGSEKRGSLEEATSHFEASYGNFPYPDVAALLSQTYEALGDVKKQHGMPGYEADYERSAFYKERVKTVPLCRGPERRTPSRN